MLHAKGVLVSPFLGVEKGCFVSPSFLKYLDVASWTLCLLLPLPFLLLRLRLRPLSSRVRCTPRSPLFSYTMVRCTHDHAMRTPVCAAATLAASPPRLLRAVPAAVRRSLPEPRNERGTACGGSKRDASTTVQRVC
jgi:hypothetical protein